MEDHNGTLFEVVPDVAVSSLNSISTLEKLCEVNETSVVSELEEFENMTCLGHAPTLTNSAVVKSIVLLVIAILSLFGNCATMFSIWRSHRTSHIYTLIFHLAVSDLCVTVWCIFGESIWYLSVEWLAGNVECKIFKFMQMFSLYLSTFIMVLIGVDRFIAVKYPLKSIQKRLCVRLISVAWGLAAILSIPQVFVFHVSRGPFIEPFYQCVTYGTYTEPWQEQLYAIFTLACMFLVPLVILVTSYFLTFWALHKNEEFMDERKGGFQTSSIDPNRRKIIRRAKMKSLRISLAIVITFLICWIPYHVMMIIFIFLSPNSQSENEELKTGIFFFGMSNSLFNPLIYRIFHLWEPRRKSLLRNNSSRRSFLTQITLNRKRSLNASCSFGQTEMIKYSPEQNVKLNEEEEMSPTSSNGSSSYIPFTSYRQMKQSKSDLNGINRSLLHPYSAMNGYDGSNLHSQLDYHASSQPLLYVEMTRTSHRFENKLVEQNIHMNSFV